MRATVNPDRTETAPSRRIFGLGWPVMLFLGWLVFELTADEALSSVVTCAKLGWNDWLTARWLRRTDPVCARGSACAWFMRALAISKVAIAATVVTVLIVWIEAAVNGGPPEPTRAFISMIVVAFVGLLLAALLTSFAVLGSLRSGHRIWVDSALKWSRWHNVWPPTSNFRRNHAAILILSALVIWLFPFAFATFFAIWAVIDLLQPLGPIAEICLVVIGFGVMVCFPMAMRMARDALTRRVEASSPWDCWPDARSNL